MSETNDKTIVSEIDLELDSLFNTGADNVMLPTTPGAGDDKNNMFSRKPAVDISFLDKDPKKDPIVTDPEELDEEGKPKAKPVVTTAEVDAIINDTPVNDDEKKTGRPRVDKAGLVELANSLIAKNLLVPFEDDKKIEDYTLKDFEELFEANETEKIRKYQEQIPAEFFKSLPPQLQYAAKYAADGGADLKGLFRSLAAVEEVRDLDPTVEGDQKSIVRSYLQATNFGDAEEIEEEINGWADRNELEAKANKFKPKLDALSEKQVQYKLHQQETLRAQQAEQANIYMDNIYKTLESGELNGLKLDKKIQNTLFTGLVQPNYQSANGKQTNLLGHLLEKYQFAEPNHGLVAEALWLLADPEGYKTKVREVVEKKVATETFRKLKTEEANKLASHTNDDEDKNSGTPKKASIPRPSNNIFKR